MHKQTSTLAGVAYLTGALVAGVGKISIDCNLNPQLLAMSDLYRFFRYRELAVEMYPDPAQAAMGCTYVPGDPATITSSAITSFANPDTIITGLGQTVPSRMKVTKPALRGVVEWYATKNDATDPFVDIQGALFLAGSATAGYYILLRYVIDFKDPLDPNLVFKRRQAKLPTQVVEPISSPPAGPASEPPCQCCRHSLVGHGDTSPCDQGRR